MPSFFADSKSSILGLSIDVYFVLELFCIGSKNFKNVKRGQIYMEDPVLGKYKSLITCSHNNNGNSIIPWWRRV